MVTRLSSFLDCKMTVFGVPFNQARLIFYLLGIAALGFYFITDFSVTEGYLNLVWRILRNLAVCSFLPLAVGVLLYSIFQKDHFQAIAAYKYWKTGGKSYEIIEAIYHARSTSAQKK